MAMYIPQTMIGRAARAIWNAIGKEETPLQDAARVLRKGLRHPDMELVRRVAAEIKESPVLVDLVWCRMVDAILAEEEREAKALAEFESGLKS